MTVVVVMKPITLLNLVMMLTMVFLQSWRGIRYYSLVMMMVMMMAMVVAIVLMLSVEILACH